MASSLFRYGRSDRLGSLSLYAWRAGQASDDVASGFFEATSVPTHYTLQCDVGSVVVASQAVIVRVERKVLAGAGAATVAGQSALFDVPVHVDVESIGSPAAFDAPEVDLAVEDAGGIDSPAAFDAPEVDLAVEDAGGIDSPVAFDAPEVDLAVEDAGGIDSPAAFDALEVEVSDPTPTTPTPTPPPTSVLLPLRSPAIEVREVGGIAARRGYGSFKIKVSEPAREWQDEADALAILLATEYA